MNKYNATTLTAKMLFNKRRLVVLVLVFSVVTFTGLMVSSLLSSLSVFFEKSVNNRIDSRTVYVSYDPTYYSENFVINEIKSIEHIIKVIPDQSKNVGAICEQFSGYNGLNGHVEIRGTNMDIMNSSNKIKNLKCGTCLIPEEFYPDLYLENKMDSSKIIKGKEYIGHTLTFIIPRFQFNDVGEIEQTGEDSFELLIVDTYDSTEYIVNENVIYANFDDVNKMNIQNYNMPGSSNGTCPVIAFVDNYSNVKNVINKINGEGFDPTVKAVYNENFISMLKIIGIAVCCICTIFSSGICGVLILKSLNEINMEIGLLKTIGFNNNKIGKLIINNILIFAGVGSLIGFVVFLIVGNYISRKLSVYSYWSKMDISINGIVLMVVFFLLFIVTSIVAFLSYCSICKKDPLDIVKES